LEPFPGKCSRDDRPPEKRKVGSSTLPLTTRSEQAICLLTCGSVTWCRTWPPPTGARSRPPKTGCGGPLLHADCTVPMTRQWLLTNCIRWSPVTAAWPSNRQWPAFPALGSSQRFTRHSALMCPGSALSSEGSQPRNFASGCSGWPAQLRRSRVTRCLRLCQCAGAR
jgi:hypothetical protein